MKHTSHTHTAGTISLLVALKTDLNSVPSFESNYVAGLKETEQDSNLYIQWLPPPAINDDACCGRWL